MSAGLKSSANISIMLAISLKGRLLVRAALRHPFGFLLLVASLLLAGGLRFLPGLERWSNQALWLLLWGFLAYAISVLAVLRTRPEPSEPELRQLAAIRRNMEARLAERRAAERSGGQTELTRILSEAIVQLEKQVAPALSQLLERRKTLSRYLFRIEQGSLPMPGGDVLERLRAIHARQQAAIEECVQQAANAAGTLVALLQEGDDASIAGQARVWAKDLLTLYDAIAEVLRGERGEDAIGELIEQSSPETAGPAEPIVPSQRGLNSGGNPPDDFSRLVQEALRRLNEPSALSKCEIIERIPKTLAAACARREGGQTGTATPLRQSQALREVLASAIEGLKPAGGATRSSSPDALQYNILHEEYVRGMSTASIMVRHSISETTFHRNRRQAIAAVAREVLQHEELLGREGSLRQADISSH
ncbi:MAG: hypothetical protein HYX94_04730 [Chloroflexi bacterium]|nr:hypothetical protein [Chloroflexota bacterium]